MKDETLPGWTGFNTMLCSDRVPDMSEIGYLPIIDQSPTEFDTVNTILLRTVEVADNLNLDAVVAVFDQAIYSKVQQIRWQISSFRERIVPRLGEFHLVMSYLKVIGKRFHETGLEEPRWQRPR